MKLTSRPAGLPALAGVVVLAGLVAATAPTAQAAPRVAAQASASGSTTTVPVNTSALRLLYDGTTIGDAQLANLQSQGQALFVAYDPASSRAGNAHAFDTMAALDAYSVRVTGSPLSTFTRPGLIETKAQRTVRLKTAARNSGLSADASPLVGGPDSYVPGCANLTYGSRDYDNGSCGGSYLTLQPNDSVSSFDYYGHNDKTSSVDIQYGGCIITDTFYVNAGFNVSGGVFRYYGADGDYAAYNFSSAQNDKVSSETSTCS